MAASAGLVSSLAASFGASLVASAGLAASTGLAASAGLAASTGLAASAGLASEAAFYPHPGESDGSNPALLAAIASVSPAVICGGAPGPAQVAAVDLASIAPST